MGIIVVSPIVKSLRTCEFDIPGTNHVSDCPPMLKNGYVVCRGCEHATHTLDQWRELTAFMEAIQDGLKEKTKEMNPCERHHSLVGFLADHATFTPEGQAQRYAHILMEKDRRSLEVESLVLGHTSVTTTVDYFMDYPGVRDALERSIRDWKDEYNDEDQPQ